MDTQYDVVILTDGRYLKDVPNDPYKHNVFLEDALLQKALINIGLRADRRAWDDPHFDWSTTQSIVFRTTWDYFDRFEEFSTWLSRVRHQTALINSETTIHWNINKKYLFDLQKRGVRIPETHLIPQGTKVSLAGLLKQYGFEEAVVKPCISGAARHTYRLNAKTVSSYEKIFADLIAQESFLLQPFQNHIVSLGEVSLMVMDGRFTHAVLKIAKEGDFRVQDDFGGTVHSYSPTQDLIEFAEHAVNSCPEIPVYARVDVFLDNQNQWALAELELIEPELWFRMAPHAADVLAQGIHKKVIDLK